MIKLVPDYKEKIEEFLSKQKYITNYEAQLFDEVVDCKCYDVKFPVSTPVYHVRLELSFEEGSFVSVEVWLPSETKGVFVGVGGGGMAGYVPVHDMAKITNLGYITAGTDLGTSKGLDWGINNIACAKDFGYRATCAMSEIGTSLAKIAYGNEKIIYVFKGGSTGGQQALTAVQKCYKYYDGVLCAAPANNRIPLLNYCLWNYVNCKSKDKKPLFNKEIAEEIQKRSKNHNGSLEDLVNSLEFLNDEQKESLLRIYKGPVNTKTGEHTYCGMPLGSETKTCGLNYMSEAEESPHLYPFVWVFGKDFDCFSYDFCDDFEKLQNTLSQHMDATEEDLTPFFERNSKLMLLAGLLDCTVPHQETLRYAKEVVKKSKYATDNFKFYLVPELDHDMAFCNLNDISGENGEALLQLLINWIQTGVAPNKLHAKKCDKLITPII